MLKVGLTGGIASGKSSVVDILRKLGVRVVETDRLAREVVAKGGQALEEIREEFGSAVLNNNGELNRERMGEIIFQDQKAREMLNEITHPRIKKMLISRLKAWAEKGCKVAVVEVPLLFEVGMENFFDEVWVVRTSRRLQLERLQERDSLTEKGAEARLNSQWPQREKVVRADRIIDNTGSFGELRTKVEQVWSAFREDKGLLKEQ